MGLPALNLSFCITVILFVMVQFSLSGIAVIPLSKISQPEAHYFKTRKLAATLRALASIEKMKEEQTFEREVMNAQEARIQEELLGEEDRMERAQAKPKKSIVSILRNSRDIITGNSPKQDRSPKQEKLKEEKDDYDEDDSL